jgi:hypothetical protein
MPIATKKQLANGYAAWLYLAEKAHEFGLDQGPVFDEKMHVARVQILAKLGGDQLHQQLAKVTDGEIENYYRDHIADYKTISYNHLLVPKQKQMDATAQKPVDSDMQKKREASETK